MEKFEDNEILNNKFLATTIVSSVIGIFIAIFNLSTDIINKAFSGNKIISIFSIFYVFVIIFAIFYTAKYISKPKKPYLIPEKFAYALKLAGITGLYQNNKGNFSQINDTLKGLNPKIGKVNNVKILAYYGHKLFSSIENPLREIMKIKENKVRIIIAENDKDFLNDVWELESKKNDLPINEVKSNGKNHYNEAFEIIKRLYDLSLATKVDFKYKYFTTQARYAVIIINNKWGFWTPYHPGFKGRDTMSFVLEKGEKPDESTILGQCLGHFNTLWEMLPYPTGVTP